MDHMYLRSTTKLGIVLNLVLNQAFVVVACAPQTPITSKDQAERQGVRLVKDIRLLKDNAGRPEWSPDGRYITYHARSDDDNYDIYIMTSDGTRNRCLTCEHPDLPKGHIGQASWHPSGDWIVFQAEKNQHAHTKLGVKLRGLAAPGIGFHNDVWIMSRDGTKVRQLTNLTTKQRVLDRTPTSAILQPHFSHGGTLLSWSERVADGGRWGKWVIRIAAFQINRGVPQLGKVRTLRPGVNKGYYESNDFMPGDKGLLISGNLEPNQDEFGIDVYYLDLAHGRTTRLTHSLDAFDECPHPSPDGSRIAYLSTSGFEPRGKRTKGAWAWWNWAKGEFWLMNADGSNKQRLTFFNEPGYPEYDGRRVIPAYVAWHPNGKQLLLGITVEVKKRRLRDQMYLVRLQ